MTSCTDSFFASEDLRYEVGRNVELGTREILQQIKHVDNKDLISTNITVPLSKVMSNL